jgi:uncharacterized protein
MMTYILAALGLCLLFESVLPFISPKLWRRTMAQLIVLPDKSLRIGAAVLMILAAVFVALSV